MGVRFTVSTRDLWQFYGMLRSTENDLVSFRDETGSRQYEGYSGSPDVEQALHAYFQHWSDGMDRIQRKLDDLSKSLGDAADLYDQSEAQIKQAATPQGTP